MPYRHGRTEDSPSQDGALIPPVGTQDSPLPSGRFLNTLSRSAVAGASTPPPPTSPREQIFGNRDIITLIFQQFLPPTTGVSDKATRAFLRQLALLCRPFSEPALDCLWNHLDSTVPLIRLLEPSAIAVDGTYYLSGSPSKLSTGTFTRYSLRVRCLRVVEDSSINTPNKVDASVYVFLAQFLRGSPLLPGLSTICFESFKDNSVSWNALPALFPCTSLSEVTLGRDFGSTALSHRVVLPLLVTLAPFLCSLTVVDHSYSGQHGSVFRDCILQFQELRTLNYTMATQRSNPSSIFESTSADAPPQSFLVGIGRKLRHLERLTLDLAFPLDPALAPVPLPTKKPRKVATSSALLRDIPPPQDTVCETLADRNLFPSIRSLTISHRSDTLVMHCVGVNSLLSNVVSLTLNLRPNWMPSFSLIVKSLARSPLLRQLSLEDGGPETTSGVSIRASDVLHLLAHLNLDELHLDIHQLRPSTEAAMSPLKQILEAAAGLQEDPEPLRSLTLPRTWESWDASLASLVDVARAAPYMQRFGISLDSSLTTSKLSEFFSLTQDIPRPSSLKYLHVRDIRGDKRPFTPAEYRAIAQFLDRCFPQLMSVTVAPSPKAATLDHWVVIEQLRVMYQENRLLADALARSQGL